MKTLLISLFTILLLSGCASTLPCEEDYTFSIRFINSTNDYYDLYINDEFQEEMAPRERVTYDIPAGYWSAEVEQVTGFTGSPRIKSYSNTYDPCTDYDIAF